MAKLLKAWVSVIKQLILNKNENKSAIEIIRTNSGYRDHRARVGRHRLLVALLEQAADGKGGQRIWEEGDPGARHATQCEIFCRDFESCNASPVSAISTTGSHDSAGQA